MKELIVQSRFWNSPYRVVVHNVSENTITVNEQTFNWDYFFQVNRIVE